MPIAVAFVQHALCVGQTLDTFFGAANELVAFRVDRIVALIAKQIEHTLVVNLNERHINLGVSVASQRRSALENVDQHTRNDASLIVVEGLNKNVYFYFLLFYT